MSFEYGLSERSCQILLNGKMYSIDRSNPAWTQVVAVIDDPTTTPEQLLALITPRTMLEDRGGDGITIRGNQVFWWGEQLHNALAKRLVDVLQTGLDIDRWITLANNIYNNPFKESRDELFPWMERHNLFTTSDGCIIAYKWVTEEYLDCHTRTVDNSVGQVVWMPRKNVDSSRALCSSGFHFCSKEYMKFGSRLMLIKINPADIVSIPVNMAGKGRCWRYEVVEEVVNPSYDEFDGPQEPIKDFNTFSTYGLSDEDTEEVDPDTLVVSESTEEKKATYTPTDDNHVNIYLTEMGNKGKTVELVQEITGMSRTKARDAVLILPLTLGTVPKVEAIGYADRAKDLGSTIDIQPLCEPTVETLLHGTITRNRFTHLIGEHGSIAGIARHFNMSAGTISAWKKKLFMGGQS